MSGRIDGAGRDSPPYPQGRGQGPVVVVTGQGVFFIPQQVRAAPVGHCSYSRCGKSFARIENGLGYSETCRKCQQLMEYCTRQCSVYGKLEHLQVCPKRE